MASRRPEPRRTLGAPFTTMLYPKIYSLFLSLHPKNKTLVHLTLSVGNHARVVLHHSPQGKVLKISLEAIALVKVIEA